MKFDNSKIVIIFQHIFYCASTPFNLFNPELVVIGGSLAQTEDYILQPVKTAVRKYSLNLVNRDSAIILSKLQNKAGMVGACLLARNDLFEL